MTNETKFTSGPWLVLPLENGFSISDKKQVVARIRNDVSGRPMTDEDEANANLIAAAPDLYSMLERMTQIALHAIDKENDRLKSMITSTDLDPPDYLDYQDIVESQELLAKARGEK